VPFPFGGAGVARPEGRGRPVPRASRPSRGRVVGSANRRWRPWRGAGAGVGSAALPEGGVFGPLPGPLVSGLRGVLLPLARGEVQVSVGIALHRPATRRSRSGGALGRSLWVFRAAARRLVSGTEVPELPILPKRCRDVLPGGNGVSRRLASAEAPRPRTEVRGCLGFWTRGSFCRDPWLPSSLGSRDCFGRSGCPFAVWADARAGWGTR
jgi:hypothetical protein